jgi:glutathione S-transferase
MPSKQGGGGAAPLRLHWSPRSPFARKVMVAAHELQIVERIECVDTSVNMTRTNAALMRSNPLNKIPTLINDNGQAWFDSLVICEYLDRLAAGPRLFPELPEQRLAALRWHALGNGLLDLLVLWRNELLRPANQQSPELLEALGAKANATIELLETECAALRATPLSIGHIAIGCALGYIDFRFPKLAWRDRAATLAVWFEGFNQRDSMQKTVPSEQ